MKTNMIGIAARKRRGKDTVADYLTHSYGFQRYAFADPIKDAMGILFDFSHEQLHGSLKDVVDERWGVTPRQVLKIWGTELSQYELPKYLPELQPIGRKIWVHRFKLWRAKNPDPKLVFSDVRFVHEAEEIKAMGGIIIKLERPSLDQPNEDLHASEMEIDQIVPDYTIINNKTLEHLYSNIDRIVPE